MRGGFFFFLGGQRKPVCGQMEISNDFLVAAISCSKLTTDRLPEAVTDGAFCNEQMDS